MARARNIKPAIFRNEVLGVSDPLHTLLFQSLWLLADREGRLEDRPIRIKADTFPYREGIDIDSMLTWLHDKGFIIRYDSRNYASDSGKNASDSRFIQIVNFLKHQNPHRNEAESIIPAYSSDCENSRKNPSDSRNYASASEEIGSAPADSLNLIPDSGILIAEGDVRPAPPPDDQDYIDRITKHDRANQPVTMTTDWKPSEQFPALMMRAGVPNDRLTDELLAKFVIHHNGTSKPNNKWESALVTWCKTEYASPPKTAQSGPYGRYVEQPMDYPLAEPDKDMYTGLVDAKSAVSALAAMREKIKQDGEAF